MFFYASKISIYFVRPNPNYLILFFFVILAFLSLLVSAIQVISLLLFLAVLAISF